MKKSNANCSTASSDMAGGAMSQEAYENRLIYLAYAQAEKQLIEGNASSQVISHFLKLGSSKERLEKEILAEQKKLIKAKTDNYESIKRSEELYEEAIAAMRRYSGSEEDNDDDI